MADDDPVASLLQKMPLTQSQRADLWDTYHASGDTDALAAALKTSGVPQPVKAALWDLKSKEAPAAPPVAPVMPPRTWDDTAVDVAKGVAKGAARTVLGAGELVNMIPGVQSSVDALYGQPGLSEKAFQAANQATEATNTPQMVGKGLETLGELAVPVGAAAEAIPTAAKAGAKFQAVMGAARNVPVDVNAPGQVALRIQELADRGASMPMAVRKFIGYATDPNRPQMTYEVARDFASNISRLSSQEYQRLTPVVGREVANLRVTLNKAVADAAGQAGKGAEYAQAMTEYARAMRVRDAVDAAIAGAKRSVPYVTAAGAGYWLTQHLKDLLP